jgi:hypothetical protein
LSKARELESEDVTVERGGSEGRALCHEPVRASGINMKGYGLYAALLGVVLGALGVSPLLAMLIIIVVLVFK